MLGYFSLMHKGLIMSSAITLLNRDNRAAVTICILSTTVVFATVGACVALVAYSPCHNIQSSLPNTTHVGNNTHSLIQPCEDNRNTLMLFCALGGAVLGNILAKSFFQSDVVHT
jgi:hypothetical protein